MASDGSVVIEARMNTSQAEKDLAKLKSQIEKTEDTLNDMQSKRDEASRKSVFDAAELDNEKAKLEQMKRDLEEMRAIAKDTSFSESARAEAKANIPAAKVDLSDQQKRVSMLQAEWNKTQSVVERYDAKIAEITATLEKQKNEAGQLQERLDAARRPAEKLKAALEGSGTGVDRLGSRIAGLAKRVFVFSMITSALRGLRTWLGNVIKTNDEANAAFARLKGALLTLAQPIVEIIIPALIKLANVLTAIVSKIASFVSGMFGKTARQSAEAAKALYEETEALNATGNAAEEASGSLAGFDEINTIQTESPKSGASGNLGGNTAPDFGSVVNGAINEVLELLTGVAFLAIGAMLTFTGANIPRGLALMAVGAAFIVDAVTSNPEAITQALQGPIGAVFALVGTAFLVLGAVLAFSGANIPLGIALMAIGAAAITSVVALNWDTVSQALQGPIGVITAIVSAALLVIGAVLLFSGGNIPLGLGLMAAGAVGLATTIAANWDTITNALQGTVGKIVAIVSVAFLAIGAILLLTGASVPLGLGLMLAGALGLAATIAANWETVQNLLQGPIGIITGIVGGALLVLGAIMTFSGANIPLGLGLLAAGAVLLVSAIAANWETIQNALQGPIGTVTAIVSAAVLVLGAVLAFSGANIPLGIGLIAAGAIGLATSIAANWETIQLALQGPIGTITALVSGAVLVLGAVLLFTGASIPLGLGLMVAGALGLAASIAANWYTVQQALGGPIGAVTAIVSGALLVLGVILLFTGAGIPLGLGLIAAGAAGLAVSIAPNWDFILDKIKGAWQNVKTWWNDNVSKFLTFDYWADLGKSVIDGLLDGLKGIFSRLSSWASSVWDTITGVFSSNNAKSSISNSANSAGNASRSISYDSLPPISNFSIPRLAQGAVIPPNREFMAVLGDQQSGTNVEAPLDTIKQALMEALRDSGGSNRPINITMMLDRKVIGKAAISEIRDSVTINGKLPFPV